MEQKVDINNSDHALDILAKFNEFRQNGKHCDFVIRAGKKEMPVHRFLLSASSEYFDAMLTHDTKEKKEGSVELREVDPECVVKCVEFIYTGKAAISEEKQGELMHVAHMLNLQRLYNGVALFLEKKLECSTFFSTRKIANLYNCGRLMEVCNEFALKNFRVIAKSDDFKKLEVDYVNFLLSSDQLKASDGIKCKSLMIWINYDSGRAASLFKLMKCIDFSKVPLSYRKFVLEDEPAVADSMECLKYVMKSVLEKTKATDMTLDETEQIVVLDNNSGRLKSFDIQENTWNDMQLLDQSVTNRSCSVAIVEEYMYVFTDSHLTFRLHYLVPDAEWEKMADRSGGLGVIAILHGVVYMSDYFQAFTNQLEKYDIHENRWSFCSNKSTACYGSAIAILQNDLLLMGGYLNNSFVTNTVERYHPESSTWSNGPCLRQARYCASATTFNDTIYVFGGYSSKCGFEYAQSVEILHLDANSWQVVNLNGFNGCYFTSHAIDEKIYLVGNNSSGFQTIQEFNPETKNLKTVCNLTGMSLTWFSSAAAVMCQ